MSQSWVSCEADGQVAQQKAKVSGVTWNSPVFSISKK